ncbi:hypothetical protein ACQP0I_16020 [Micromonospora carbonacea]|uniref:hypothetical protein n=1 Tax=Micromonospora carbonacea TaxID=47853 RepID=UPI003D99F056
MTVTAASSGPSRPGTCVGHGSPPRTTPPATAIGAHQPHDSRYARAKNDATGQRRTNPRSSTTMP